VAATKPALNTSTDITDKSLVMLHQMQLMFNASFIAFTFQNYFLVQIKIVRIL